MTKKSDYTKERYVIGSAKDPRVIIFNVDDACLIAAAHDLLEACEQISSLLYKGKHIDERIDFELFEQAALQCKEAIATAKRE